jgi:hypothetical protein
MLLGNTAFAAIFALDCGFDRDVNIPPLGAQEGFPGSVERLKR